ncbi:hypothetical protein AB5I39_15590 [Sphingomonas sp. MMS24-J45]|uniref:hypothetical protein n=1 Tax=Sphingomonas sp. MMS24-J45 TaxID=3238806 RepID=UPI00384D528C
MATSLEHNIRDAAIDLSAYAVSLDGADAPQPDVLTERIAAHLTGTPGFAILYATRQVLAAHGLDIAEHRDAAYALLESVFRGAMARIEFRRFTVVDRPMALASMDVDGFNLNGGFSHDNKIESRAFMTSKCLHFDAATPFVANIYGLNENIGGGHPLLSDVRAYCRDHGVKPSEVVDAIPNNYNVVIAPAHYAAIRDQYTVGLDIDIDTDMIAILLLNEVAFGVAHGATAPYRIDESRPARRPLRHFEYQFEAEDDYVTWYGHYDVPMVEAKDYAGENLSLDYYEPAPFDRFVRIGA